MVPTFNIRMFHPIITSESHTGQEKKHGNKVYLMDRVKKM